MESSNSLVVEKKCPLCNIDAVPYRHETVNLAGSELKLGFNICGRCGLQFVSPRLSEKGLRVLYDSSYMEATVSGHYNTDKEVSHGEYKTFQKYINDYSNGTAWNILDVGCGVGNLLDTLAAEDRYVVRGVEFSEYAWSVAAGKGHKVWKGDLLELEFDNERFDCITMMYVLEHIPEPLQVIRKAFELLRPGGYLMAAVPNLRYLELVNRANILRFLTGRPATMHPLEHLQNFTPRTFRKMIETAGFAIDFVGMAKPLQTGPFYVKAAKAGAWLLFALLHKLGYTMGGIHVIARKKG